jgi:DNA-binding GntR family transcriptional regulator
MDNSDQSAGSHNRSERAYDLLLDMILSGEMPGGTVIRERRLSEALGLSRTPLREAIGRLEGERFLKRQQGRSLVVEHITVNEYIQILHVRRVVEREAVELAAGRIPPETLVRMRSMVENLSDPDDLSAEDHWAVDDTIHETIADACGNKFLAYTIQDLRRKTRMFDLKRMPDRFESGRREHLLILDALDRKDPAAASKAMTEHIENVKASILRKLGEP